MAGRRAGASLEPSRAATRFASQALECARYQITRRPSHQTGAPTLSLRWPRRRRPPMIDLLRRGEVAAVVVSVGRCRHMSDRAPANLHSARATFSTRAAAEVATCSRRRR